MKLRTLFRTSVFQLTLAYTALFTVSAVALVAFLYWSTFGYIERQTNAVIEAEINGLSEQYKQGGLSALKDVIDDRVMNREDQGAVYLLANLIGTPYAGNLHSWPRELDRFAGEWVDFTVRDPATGRESPVRAMVFRFGLGFRLLVGRDTTELTRVKEVFQRALFYGLPLVLGLSLLGGLLVARGAQRRLADLNRTTRQIMAGDLTRRAPLSGSHDEHDELAQNINAMLDQIEGLLEGMRHVGDSVAHDLRGPLTRLRNRLETLAASAKPDRDDIAECVAQVDHVLDTFNALLRIARVESGAHRSAFAAVELGKIVRDVAELYQAAADERSIALSCDCRARVEVFGDRELLAQALTNLLDNAVKYTPPGGSVKLTLERTDDTAVVRVADTGPGVPEADRERVLQRFARLDQARSQPGNGLGLALVKAVALQHHGRLTLSDNAPGLVVILELPALAQAPAALAAPA
ncbi:MAG TPA: HAMP domain-containing sensor histidine kinase [Gammaproteobacteria bacterium]|nr:HAMP domain-containing sensor histidine kinase [Gammaproteobacteria bacterium]